MSKKKVVRYVFDDSRDEEANVIRSLQLLECDTVIKALSSALRMAQENKWPYIQFLNVILEQEMQARDDKRVERWRKSARFPWLRNLTDYNFARPQFIEKEKVLKLAECRWIENGGNVIFFGSSGVGKTHLSIALGLEAITKGFETRFITLDQLMELSSIAVGKDKAFGGGENRKKFLTSFSNIKLLILDDLAYTRIDPEVSDLLFQIIFRRHEKKASTIFTSNEGLETWEKYFPNNPVRTMAVLDRILHDCVPINIRGQSFRSTPLQTARV